MISFPQFHMLKHYAAEREWEKEGMFRALVLFQLQKS